MFFDAPRPSDKSTGARERRAQNPEWDTTVPDHHLGIDFNWLAPYNTETWLGQALPVSIAEKLLQNPLPCFSIDVAKKVFGSVLSTLRRDTVDPYGSGGVS
jgi:hypothetical protein